MADALKRIGKSKDKAFQDRCTYYMYEKAAAVFAQETPDADDLLLAKALWAGQVKALDMARIVVTNSTIGGTIDNDNTPLEDNIQWAITSDDAGAQMFHTLAESYKAAGLIGA